jgi:glycosyltransferase involved in cell wall biosynthesis
MRSVLFLARGGAIDGQQRQVLYLATGLKAAGTRVVIALDEEGPLQQELAAAGVESHILRQSTWRRLGHGFHRYLDAYRIARLAAATRAQILHAHDVWRAEYARFAAQRLGVPSIVHVRGPMTARDMDKHRLTHADHIIAIGQRYVDDLAAGGIDRTRVTLIDDAVDTRRFSADVVDKEYIARAHGLTGRPIIGIVGRISAFKQIVPFLEMVALSLKDIPATARFLIVGSWECPHYRQYVEQALDRLALRQRVHVIGRCPHETMPSLLASLDLLVTLSGGSTMYEAMAVGTAVLSIREDSPNSREIPSQKIIARVGSGRIEDGAAAITRLVNDTALRLQHATAGRELYRNRLPIERMVQQTLGVYALVSQHDQRVAG